MPSVNFSTTRGFAGETVRITTATTTLVKTGQGAVLGFLVASTTGGTLVFHDALSAIAPLTGTITPGLGWFALPLQFSVGLTVVSANTIDVTIVYL